MEKKKLVINCADCDMRGIKPELLNQYEKITINAANIITSRNVQVMSAPFDVELNCANVTVLEDGVELLRHNGAYRIKAGDRIPEKKFYLTVNGKVAIEAGTEEILRQCTGISVNGMLTCPASIQAVLPELHINGKTEYYPDGAVVLSRVFCPDYVFALRAKKQDYYVSRMVVLEDETLEVKELLEKGVHFITPKALVSEKLLRDAIPLFDAETEIEVLKEGMRYLQEDITLEEKHLAKYGVSLYVDGNVRIEDAKILERVERLYADGTIRLKEELEKAFLEKGAAVEYKKLVVERGTCISDRISFTIEPKLLEKGKVFVTDVASLSIAPEVTEEMIMENLSIRDCADVKCSAEQRTAVEMVSQDVANIRTEEEEEDGELGLDGEASDTKAVNTSSYTF